MSDQTGGKTVRAGRAFGAGCLCAVAGCALLGGCEVDSYFDQSATGRFEHTPTIVPILERLSAIEDEEGQLVEYSEISADDLKAEAIEYRLIPGDDLDIVIFDIVQRGEPSLYRRSIDLRGEVNIPQLGNLKLQGRTAEEARALIAQAASRLVSDPLVQIDILSRRQQIFHVIGAVEQPGPFFIPRPDYRLLEAVTNSGRFFEAGIPELYVIRQVSLNDSSVSGAPEPIETDRPTPKPRELIDLIDDLTKPKPSNDQNPSPAPGDPPSPAPGSPGSPGNAGNPGSPTMMAGTRGTRGSTRAGQPDRQPPQPPPIDLVEPLPGRKPVGEATQNGTPRWVFLNGQWVQVKPAAPGTTPAPESPRRTPDDGTSVAPATEVTQRIIRIPTKPLLAGDARYNIVIRPGDTIRVPAPPDGVYYMDGQINRSGAYQLPSNGKMTLKRAVASAGGLGGLAIPERVELTRVVGPSRQATIRLNYRAIQEGTQPDIYVKADDVINIGTNFWSLPIAVARGGFRATYGFGFLLDRNFADDVFGRVDPFR